MHVLIVVVVALLAVCIAAILGERVRIAPPILLVTGGVILGLLPVVPAIHIEPEWILAGLLPPLLYSASVSIPKVTLRREFGAITGLSVVLVTGISILLGLLFWWLIPDVGLAWGIALGAVISPTDAVAVSIVRATGIAPRTVAILEGEGLFNDATALVVLRTAIAASAASVSLLGVVGDFAYAIVIAVVVGVVVGKANIAVRAKVEDETVTTALSFVVPFAASLPAEAVGASGLVAAVVAGVVTGQGALRRLSVRQRLSEHQNWRTIEFLLEGIVFLTMGLQFHTLVDDLPADDGGLLLALGVAAVALAGTILIRAGYVFQLLNVSRRRATRGAAMRSRFELVRAKLEDGRFPVNPGDPAYLYARKLKKPGRSRFASPDMDMVRSRIRRALADLDYLIASPLTARDGAVIAWAGMRGAITVAAAQTLPEDTPHRSLLVLIAFLVAGLSLLLQGSTLRSFVERVKPTPAPDAAAQAADRQRITEFLQSARAEVADTPAAASDGEHIRLGEVKAERDVLLAARDDGLFDQELLTEALNILDSEQISLELRDGARAG